MTKWNDNNILFGSVYPVFSIVTKFAKKGKKKLFASVIFCDFNSLL